MRVARSRVPRSIIGSRPRPFPCRTCSSSVPLDPWGNPYVYISPGEINPTGYDLLSLGADGKSGSEGENADLTSW